MPNFNLQEYLEKTEKEFRERFDEFVIEKNGRIVASEESVLQFLRSAIETAVKEAMRVERQRLRELIKDRKFEVEEKRTGALHEMYEAGYYSALSDILKLLSDENIVEELNDCEKCGGETGRKLIGDETYDKCSDCNHINTP